MMEISSQARIDFSYQLGEDKPLTYKTVYSNIVSVALISNILSIERRVDKEETEIYDTISYTVSIHNLTQIPITEITFTDKLADNLLFVPGSVRMDEQKEPALHPQKGFMIPLLSALGSITVVFTCVIQSDIDSRVITKADLHFLFSSNRLLPAAPMELSSPETLTRITRSLFKAFHITNTLQLPTKTSNIPAIAEIQAVITPLNMKLVETAVHQLPHKPELPILLLLSDAIVQFQVTYRHSPGQSISANRYIGAFRAFLYVPQGIRYCSGYQTTYQVTGVEYYIKHDKLICDVSLLLSL